MSGTKQWTLFPPSDRCHLPATRVPYEESSVYSRLDLGNMARNYRHLLHKVWSTLWSRQRNFLLVDGFSVKTLVSFLQLRRATPYQVTLHPGDVLYVPPQWWHQVQC